MTIKGMKGYTPKYITKLKRKRRDSGSYAQIKIDAFTSYSASAQHVFKSNKARGVAGLLVYFEPFCGPGMNSIRETRCEVKGTALLAIDKLKAFDTFIFNDLDVKTLNSLYSELVDLGLDTAEEPVIYLYNQDANQTVQDISEILPKSVVGARYPVMGVAVVDPPGLNFKWSAVLELARHRLDFVGMLSTHHDLTRNLTHPSADSQNHVVEWFGGTPPHGKPRDVISAYEGKLKGEAGYTEVFGPTTSAMPGHHDVWVPGAYHLFLATRCPNDVAKKIWTGVCKSANKSSKGSPLPFGDWES